MNVPVPTPRTQTGELKKPVPTPRQCVKKDEPSKSEEGSNTFSRRVRSLSNASKQIAEDIGELVHDKKKAVIEGTRQSVRRIAKHFNTNLQEQEQNNQNVQSFEAIDDNLDIFSSISFQSPISTAQSIYNNVDDSGSAPPAHPPPSLPDSYFYDTPSSLSESTSTSENSQSCKTSSRRENYESVFPAYRTNSVKSSNNSDSDISQSGSWQFYKSALKTENIYNDIDNTTPIIGCKSDTNANSVRSDFSVDMQNCLYKNVVDVKEETQTRKLRDSVINQFDPLRNNFSDEGGVNVGHSGSSANDLDVLEKLLYNDIYGNLTSVENLEEWSISNDSDQEDCLTPPLPPVRYDSLPEQEQSQPTISKEKIKTNRSISAESIRQSLSESKKLGWLKQVLEKAPETIRGHKNKDMVIQRPELDVQSLVYKKGMLYKVQSGPVEDLFGEYSGRWCVLQNSNLVCYADNSCDSVKEYFPADTILSVQILQDTKFKYKYDNNDLHCFELNTSGKGRGGHIYGARDMSERRIWMQCIAESLTKKFSAKITTDYIRMGWAYLREGVSSKWKGAWIVLSQRTLYYALDHLPVKTVDLRKVRCIVLQGYQEGDNNPRTNDKGPNVVVDSHDITLYLRMWTSRETKVWSHIIKLSAHNNGAHLDQQQITKNEIPVVVEKCINFIYVHGSMSEGIYRRPGSGAIVAEILTKFRKDAWAVQLTRDKYSEHDVATALKRFFRDLPEPLLLSSLRQYLHEVSLRKNVDDKVRMYKAALDQLPIISYKTTKKLLGHLHFIASQCAKNLMNVDNLASLWGPTLMYCDDATGEGNPVSKTKHQQDVLVVKQLLELYKYIFPEDPEEMEQEKLMLQVLEKYTKSPQGAVNSKKAGDFRVWIYLKSKEGQAVHIAVGPNKTSYEVCIELSSKMKLPVDQLILEEVVLNDHLIRPIHHSEKVLDIILGWSYWEEADRKDNHLIISPITKYSDLIQEKSSSLSGELKFSDSKTKHFKLYTFEFAQDQLKCFKDRTRGTNLHTWYVKDIVWYLGNEPKRNASSRWTATFLETKTFPKRTKTSPYFGNILAWNDLESRTRWLATMLKSRYQDSLTPPAMHINLMT